MLRTPASSEASAEVEKLSAIQAKVSETHKRVQRAATTHKAVEVVGVEARNIPTFYAKRVSATVAPSRPDCTAELTPVIADEQAAIYCCRIGTSFPTRRAD